MTLKVGPVSTWSGDFPRYAVNPDDLFYEKSLEARLLKVPIGVRKLSVSSRSAHGPSD